MRTYPIYDDEGNYRGFEIANVNLTDHSLDGLLSSIKGVKNVRRCRKDPRTPEPDSRGNVLIRFDYRGQAFSIGEVITDSSRYWVRPDGEPSNGNRSFGTRELERIFGDYREAIAARIAVWLVILLSLAWLFYTAVTQLSAQ